MEYCPLQPTCLFQWLYSGFNFSQDRVTVDVCWWRDIKHLRIFCCLCIQFGTVLCPFPLNILFFCKAFPCFVLDGSSPSGRLSCCYYSSGFLQCLIIISSTLIFLQVSLKLSVISRSRCLWWCFGMQWFRSISSKLFTSVLMARNGKRSPCSSRRPRRY